MSVLFYRIATSAALLPKGNFVALNLPLPSYAIYSDHTTRTPQGGGGEGRQGYDTAELGWLGNNRLDAGQAQIINNLIITAEAAGGQGNGSLWLTLPKTTGQGYGWIDVSGIAIMPRWEPTEGANGLAYENVVLKLNDCAVVNDPSSVGVY